MSYLKEELYSLIGRDMSVFDFIQESALDGLVYWDLEQPENSWINPAFWKTLGYDPGNAPSGPNIWMEIVHPDDLKIAANDFLKNYEDINFDKGRIFRYKHKNGSTVWMQCKCTIIRNQQAKATRILGAHIDVTDLKKKEEVLEKCNAASNIGFWEVDLKSDVVTWSAVTRQIYELPDDFQPNTKSALSFFKEGESREAISQAVLNAINAGIPYDLEVEFVTAKGKVRWTKAIGIPEFINGKCVKLYGTFQDIHDREMYRLQLAQEREKYKNVILATNVGTWEWNVQTGEAVFDERWAEIFGYKLEELMPVDVQMWIDMTHPDDQIISDQKLELCFERKAEYYECECRMKHKDGHWVWIYDRGKVFSWTPEGKPLMMFGTLQDITENKKKTERLSIFVRHAPTAIAMFDTEMKYIAVSEKWLADYGLNGRDLIGRSHYEIFPEIGEEWKMIHQECLAGATHKEDEDQFVRADGSIQWLKWEDTPWTNDLGKIGGIIMFTEDITAKKEVEEKLRISEEAFRGNFENAAIGMAILNEDGQWLQANKKLCSIFGYSEEELLQKSLRDLTHPDDLKNDLALLFELMSGRRENYQMENRYMHKDGHIVYVILAASVVKNLEGEILYLISQIIDISDLKKAEYQLAQEVEKNQGILAASTQVSIITTDTNGIITTFNEGAENLLGYSAAEIIGIQTPVIFHNLEEIKERGRELSVTLGKNISGFEIFTALADKGMAETREWIYVRKNGTQFPVQLTVSPIVVSNKITGYLGIAADISTIKKAETEIQALLDVTKDQNSRLKNFAHIVSHNLRSHSGNMDFLIDLLTMERPELKDMEIITLIKNASSNLKETIAHLNEVALINTSLKESLQEIVLFEYVEKAFSNVAALAIAANVELINNVDKDDRILGLPAYIDSILLNFLTNGIKYSSDKEARFVKVYTRIENNYVVLYFEDNGLGIDLKRHGARLFGMYKTFHERPDSRGIGLFITKSQIEAMGGKIEVESEENKGTIFKVYLTYGKS